ncbi:hypothetical protein QAD02_020406 [Eretmocerus hayati]|uniref:Uncharacterized protein n=1 Tax=Eretmocerus hayati TaxID=131215 RepID=A0ACC2PNJ2_9HYME|nr:hypothetical protein QAD02_020406 [Eretmocerus hayati]
MSQQSNPSLVVESKTKKWFRNLTDISIPEEIKEIFALGPKFNETDSCLSDKNIPEIIKSVEGSLSRWDAKDELKSDIRSTIIDEMLRWKLPKKQRRVVRAAFTRVNNELKELFAGENILDELLIAFEFLETKYSSLTSVHADFHALVYELNMTEDQITAEIQSDDEYTKLFIAAKRQIARLTEAEESARAASNLTLNTSSPPTSAAVSQKALRLPKIEFPKFAGAVKEWLPF